MASQRISPSGPRGAADATPRISDRNRADATTSRAGIAIWSIEIIIPPRRLHSATGDYRNRHRHSITCAGMILPGAGTIFTARHHIISSLEPCHLDLSSAVFSIVVLT